MKRLYLLLLIPFFFISSLQADAFKGYIVTLNGKRLTGYIGAVTFPKSKQSEVIFINDFGTPYQIKAQLIKGFVFIQGSDYRIYESKYDKKRWMFLQVLYKGEGMSLYMAPQERVRYEMNNGFFRTQSYNVEEYWLEVEDKAPIKLKRMGFKKKFRRLIARRAPELAAKIGTKGYKFSDLQKIIEEYNDKYDKTKWKL